MISIIPPGFRDEMAQLSKEDLMEIVWMQSATFEGAIRSDEEIIREVRRRAEYLKLVREGRVSYVMP